MTEVFPCFFLSCKANARVEPSKMGHGPHSSKCLCSTYFLSCDVLRIVCVYMCNELLPPGGYLIAVNKYIISIIYHNSISLCNTGCPKKIVPFFIFFFLGAQCVESGVSCTDCY